MDAIEQIEARKEEIIKEIQSIRAMRRGTINKQYIKVTHKGTDPALKGPYYVLTKKEQGKTVSKRISSDRVDKITEETETHKRFNNLAKEFVDLSEKMADTLDLKEDAKKNT